MVFIFSAICKKGDVYDDDVDEDEKDPQLAKDELWLYEDGGRYYWRTVEFWCQCFL